MSININDMVGGFNVSFGTVGKGEVPSLQEMLMSGGVNASDIGATNHGSTEANIAQRGEVYKHLDNLMNGGGDKITYNQVMGQDGQPIKIPYVDSDTGNLVFPNDQGIVRAINGGYLARWKELNDKVEDKIDDVMDYCVISDELAGFVLGIAKAEWTTLTATDGGYDGMHAEMKKLNCSITYIKSLPSGSVLQTQSLSKLRFIVRENLRNVNIKNLISKEKMKKDMNDGDLRTDNVKYHKANVIANVAGGAGGAGN